MYRLRSGLQARQAASAFLSCSQKKADASCLKIELTDEERRESEKLTRSGLTSVRLALRTRIVLLAAEGRQNKDIAVRLDAGRVQEWLDKHPRIHMHFTPTSASWLNMVERFFYDITTERLRRGGVHQRVRSGGRH